MCQDKLVKLMLTIPQDCRYEKGREVSMVEMANAVVYPRTVVVHLLNTPLGLKMISWIVLVAIEFCQSISLFQEYVLNLPHFLQW